MKRENLVRLIGLTKIPNLGPVLIRQVVSYCGGVEAVFSAEPADLLSIPQIGKVTAQQIVEGRSIDEADRLLSIYEQKGVVATSYLDDDYPRRLSEINDAPVVLYSRGIFNYNASRTVAMVGTRAASEYGKIMSDRLVEELRPYNVQIISGLAYGIDIASHRAAVKHGLETIAILGSGVDNVYPGSHRDFASKMCDRGGLISEFDPGTGPDRENFPMRNRIIAGMSDALIVVESKYKGGSMISADFAFDFSRDVFAVPGRVDDELSAGPNKLIRIARAQLIHSGGDVARAMMWEKDGKMTAKQSRLLLDLTDKEREIINAIQELKKPSLDELSYRTGYRSSELSTDLLQLEFKAVVKSLPGNRYVLL